VGDRPSQARQGAVVLRGRLRASGYGTRGNRCAVGVDRLAVSLALSCRAPSLCRTALDPSAALSLYVQFSETHWRRGHGGRGQAECACWLRGTNTVTIVRVGTTKKYSEGWSSAFGKGKKAAPAEAPKATKKSPAKSAAKKPAKTSAKKKPAKKGKK